MKLNFHTWEEYQAWQTREAVKGYLIWFCGLTACIAFWLVLFAAFPKKAPAFTDNDAIRAIVGEAANQGMLGMECVGEVIRTRGSLGGFCGFRAKHSASESALTWRMAKEAWEASKYTHYTHGANHFENIHAFGKPYWLDKCVLTFSYRDHNFYREKI